MGRTSKGMGAASISRMPTQTQTSFTAKNFTGFYWLSLKDRFILNTAQPAPSENGTIQSLCDYWTVGDEGNRSGAACRLLRMFCTGKLRMKVATSLARGPDGKRTSRLRSSETPSLGRTRRSTLAAAIILLWVCGIARVQGQSTASGLPTDAPPEYTSLKRFPQNLGANFLAMFSTKNIAPLLIGSASTGVISIWDEDIQEHFSVHDGSSSFGKFGSALGSLYVVAPVVGGLLIAGNRSKNDRFHSFTYSLAQATVLDEGLTYGMKLAISRTRPDASNDRSFPSSHASTSFMIATVTQRYYGWKAGLVGYGVASAISIARVRGNKHWASDVAAGATLGYLVGSSVSRRTRISIRGTEFSITPTVDLANRRVGVFLNVN